MINKEGKTNFVSYTSIKKPEMDDAQSLLIRKQVKENSMEDNGKTGTKTYDLRPRAGKENIASSAGGLALNQP